MSELEHYCTVHDRWIEAEIYHEYHREHDKEYMYPNMPARKRDWCENCKAETLHERLNGGSWECKNHQKND